MTLADMTVADFTALVASDAPAPGGGSCAALLGSIGAALAAMAAGLTRGRQKYAEFAPHAETVERSCLALREQLLDVMDRDTLAFRAVSDAFSLPRDTDEQKAARSAAIQAGLKGCTETPLEMMALADEAAALAHSLLGRFNDSAASDLGVAFLALRSAAQGAWLNVLINLSSIKDPDFAAGRRARGEALLAHTLTLTDEGYAAITELLR